MTVLDFRAFMDRLSSLLFPDDDCARDALATMEPTEMLANVTDFDSLSMFRAIIALEIVSGTTLDVEGLDVPELAGDLYGIYLLASAPSSL